VGHRNRKHFVRFVLASTLQLLLVFAVCVMRLVDATARRYSGALRGAGGPGAGSGHVFSLLLQACVQSAIDQPINCCCCVVLALLLVKLLPFCQFHVYIVAVGQTTFEHIKKTYHHRHGAAAAADEAGEEVIIVKNPFDRGVCGNYSALCCSPVPATRIGDLREVVSREQFIREEVDPDRAVHLSSYGAV